MQHLLTVLREQIFQPIPTQIALRWAEADPKDRAHMVQGPHADWSDMTAETVWGRPDAYFWFAGRIAVPEGAVGRSLWLRVEAAFGRVMGRSDPQCLVRVNGQIVQGADFNHREVPLTKCAKAGGAFDILIEAGTIEDRRQPGLSLTLLAHDPLAEALYYDLQTPLDVAKHLPENDHRRDVILSTVADALRIMDLRPGDPARRVASLTAARQIAARIPQAAQGDLTPEITVTGHTHIDVAWLWRVRETRQKMARSMATALSMMADYPDYRFMYNQGYLLDTLSQDYPDLFEGLKQAQAKGQFEVEGALWLEPDANMASGESLVRQIIKGVAYHGREFGVRPRIVWLPDTFGYSAALPQILRASGMEVFITHKMSWNDTNRMPHETFFWQGIDGSRVPTVFLTTQPMESTSINTTYCPDLKASHVMGTWRRYGQKGANDHLFLVYGHGDGGGGPTREMLEHIRRMEAGIPGCPRVRHDFMGPALRRITETMAARPEDFPDWVGELYLEFHRGTFTSVAEVKRNNRRAEAILRELEAMAVLSGLNVSKDLAALWDCLLLNQFHDILPGSSIGAVYEDSRKEFAKFFRDAQDLGQRLASAMGIGVVNPYGQPRAGLIDLAVDQPLSVDGVAPQQIHFADGTVSAAAPIAPIAPVSARSVHLAPSEWVAGGMSVSARHLENDLLCVEFDAQGRMTRLYDKIRNRDALATGTVANRLQAFRDLPPQFDAWDIDASFEAQSWDIDTLTLATVVETGPYRAAIRFEWRYESSTIVQVVSLTATGAVVEFDTCIDWKEQNTLVKAAFPLALQSTGSIAEIQFGHVTRPSHRNTSWDQARFETPMQRWVAMEEPGFGAALLNDCKYGYDAKGTTLRLTLLRSPTWPWDGADQGRHRFRYGITLHDGVATGQVQQAADDFNHPLTLWAGQGGQIAPLIGACPGLSVESVKPAEDGQGIVLRLVERLGQRQSLHLPLRSDITQVWACDLIEENRAPLTIQDNRVALTVSPFQILSLYLKTEYSHAND